MSRDPFVPRVDDPIARIEWRDVDTLDANDYNPNHVFGPEMRLLERSILAMGWVQPILVTRDGVIVDGFHRATLARTSAAIRERYGAAVPCAVLDLTRPAAMMTTIRINRAKGTHAALHMHAIVRELIETHGFDPQEVAAEIGATIEEIDLLRQEDVFEAKGTPAHRYSRAWVPTETRPKRAAP